MWTGSENVNYEYTQSQNKLKVKFKKLYVDVVKPSYAKDGDAGLDLTATHMTFDENFIEYGTGIAVEIPQGYVGLIFPRSSVSKSKIIMSLELLPLPVLIFSLGGATLSLFVGVWTGWVFLRGIVGGIIWRYKNK